MVFTQIGNPFRTEILFCRAGVDCWDIHMFKIWTKTAWKIRTITLIIAPLLSKNTIIVYYNRNISYVTYSQSYTLICFILSIETSKRMDNRLHLLKFPSVDANFETSKFFFLWQSLGLFILWKIICI